MLSADSLLALLPAFKDERILIKQNQKVTDIIDLILKAHKKYAHYYDVLAPYFDASSVEKICNNIYNFLREEIKYNEESEDYQTTALPAAILSWKEGDCKHYSLFAGGILSAIERTTGKKIKWCYRFASYQLLSNQPHHVFVVVFDKEKDLWIDPVPGAEKLTPIYLLDKYVKNFNMALYDVVGSVPQIDETDAALPQPVKDAVAILLANGCLFADGSIDTRKVNQISASGNAQAQTILQAYQTITDEALKVDTVGGFIQDAAHAVAKVTLAVPRNAFLLLLGLNVKGWATKVHRVWIEGTKEDGDKLYNAWYKVGGSWDAFTAAVTRGYQKKSIGSAVGIVEPVSATVAATATAAPIIAAIVTVLTALINKLGNPPQQEFPTFPPDPGSGELPNTPTTGSSNSIFKNPLLLGAMAAGAYYLYTKSKRRVSGANDNTLLLLGGGVAIYLLTRKDKNLIVVPDVPPTKDDSILTDVKPINYIEPQPKEDPNFYPGGNIVVTPFDIQTQKEFFDYEDQKNPNISYNVL